MHELPYPTCGKDACRIAWSKTAQANAQRALRARIAECNRCADCKRVLPMDHPVRRCPKCAVKNRIKGRNRRREMTFRAYQERIAMARAEREIRRKEHAEAALANAEAEQVYQETRENAKRGWLDEYGSPVFEEL
jgi:hypothetical protein